MVRAVARIERIRDERELLNSSLHVERKTAVTGLSVSTVLKNGDGIRMLYGVKNKRMVARGIAQV